MQLNPGPDIGSLVYRAAYDGNAKALKKILARFTTDKAAKKKLREYLKWRHPHGGATAMYVACEFKYPDVVQVLLEHDAPVDQPRDDGATPLYKATQDGNLAIVSLLVKHGAKVATVVNGMSPLWVACHHGRCDLAKVLLEAKADPTAKVQEWSPIMLAEREGNAELVALLAAAPREAPPRRARGGRRRRRRRRGRRREHAARAPALPRGGPRRREDRPIAPREGRRQPCRLGLGRRRRRPRRGGGGRAGFGRQLRARAGRRDAAVRGVRDGPPRDGAAPPRRQGRPQPRPQERATPLSVVCENGRLDLVKLLLEAEDVKVNQCSEVGATPLMLACFRGHGGRRAPPPRRGRLHRRGQARQGHAAHLGRVGGARATVCGCYWRRGWRMCSS